MSPNLHVQFLLEPHSSDVLTPSRHEPSTGDPPPWEPLFEDLSSHSPHLPQRRPLDPPPLCFSTTSPCRIRSHDFPPFRIPSHSDRLTDGFRVLYPHSVLDKHGISRSDWARFLEDLGIAARLSRQSLSAVGSRAPVAPLTPHRILPRHTPGAVYDGRFARSPAQEVCALIELWNQCAFERRKIRVSLQLRPIGTGGRKNYVLLVESL